jgi:hypothetical protein
MPLQIISEEVGFKLAAKKKRYNSSSYLAVHFLISNPVDASILHNIFVIPLFSCIFKKTFLLLLQKLFPNRFD